MNENVTPKRKEIIGSIISLIISLAIVSGTVILFSPSDLFFKDKNMFISAGVPKNVGNVINIKDYDDSTNYYLTSVSLMKTSNVLQQFLVMNNDRYELYEEQEHQSNSIEDKEYAKYMENVTERSLNNAVYIAYKTVGNEIEVHQSGVIIEYIEDADNIDLKRGDYIIGINDIPIETRNELMKEMSKYKIDDEITLTIIRQDNEIQIKHKLVNVNDKPGLGVYAVDYQEIELPEEVIFDRGNLEGPSAGLMFSLHIIDTLKEENLSKGYKIAGTGTIDKNGNVGQIGGIEYKLYGAITNNIDIFFVPKDITEYDTNEKDAKEYLKDKKSDIKLVPVESLEDALDYLDSLSDKE